MILPEDREKFKDIIKLERRKLPTSKKIVKDIIAKDQTLIQFIEQKEISKVIKELRQAAYKNYLKIEDNFSKDIMKRLPNLLKAPEDILDRLITADVLSLNNYDLKLKIKDICGDYSGQISPFIYVLNLCTTQSRRASAGHTFESIIYSLYEIMNYSYDSQKKVGSKIFDEYNLGKKVDSIIPSIECFNNKRTKVIIGTMKTTLRERWQEVAEEIARTKIPEIHLLTCDTDISSNKAEEMKQHNITVVVYKEIKNKLNDYRNLISFEDYFFEEIPNIFKYWNEN